MRKGRLRVPLDSVDRFLADAKKDPGYRISKWMTKGIICLRTAYSATVSGAYHFDSIDDYLRHRGELRGNKDDVVLKDLTVATTYSDFDPMYVPEPGETKKYRHQLGLEDETGMVTIDYLRHVTNQNGYPATPYLLDDPILGAEVGDRIDVNCALFKGYEDPLFVFAPFLVRNDAHHERRTTSREEAERVTREIVSLMDEAMKDSKKK